jgi:leader peptidase (prepilin peptidase)/N-methyltransferase
MQANFLLILETEFPVLTLVIGSLFGLIIGSFLNVVTYRIPKMLEKDWKSQAQMILAPDSEVPVEDKPFNLIFPNSHCPSCDVDIKPWENIPVISYLFLKGKCAACATPISIRYPLIEILTAFITGLVIYKFGLTLACLFALLLCWSLICLAMIDFDHQLLPDNITLPLLWIGLIANSFNMIVSFQDAFWGAIAGYMSLWSLFWIFKLISGKEGMGYGDFKLLALLGAWMGWQSLPLIVILSSMSGTLIGGTLVLMGRDRTQPMPFGPFLAIAGWINLMWGDQITLLYYQHAFSGA